MKVVVVSAHLDDFEVGFGGLATLLVSAGHEVVSVNTTPGKANVSHEGRFITDVRIDESRKSHSILGLKPMILSYFEQMLSVNPETRKVFQELILGLKPDCLFTHWGMDTNPDHRATAMLAIEPCLGKGVNTELFCYEVASGRGRPQSLGFFPTHYVNIAEVLEVKRKMVMCHTSQNPEAIWNEQLAETHVVRGTERKCEYAEAYMRLTRYGPLHPELAKFLIPTRFHLPRGTSVAVIPELIGLTV